MPIAAEKHCDAPRSTRSGADAGATVWVRKEEELQVLAGALFDLPDFRSSVESTALLPRELAAEMTAKLSSLRPHQRDAVTALLSAPLGRGIAELATAAGKSRIAVALAACARAAELAHTILVLVPGPQQSRAMEREFIDCWPALALDLGLCGGICDVTVRTYQWLAQQGEDDVEVGAGLLICDECHRVGATSYSRAIAGVTALLRAGLSATPLDRADERNSVVVGLLGTVVYSIGYEELARLGFVSPGSIL